MDDPAPASLVDWPTDDDNDPASANLAFNAAILWIVTAAGFVLVLQARNYIQKLGGWSPGRRRQPKAAAPSPPPLTKLRDMLHDGEPAHPFSKCVEVINLVTPPSGSPGNRRGRLVTPGAGRAARNLSTGPRPGPSPGLDFSTPLSHATPDYTPDVTPASRSLLARSLFSPWTQGRQQPAAAPQVQEAQGWDPALLQACQQQESAISSLDGLHQSKEFQAHIRSTHGNLDRHMDQVSTRLDTYRTLRAIDRPGFLHALTRSNVQDFETWQLPIVLGLLDVAVTTAITWSVWYAWLAVDSGYGWLLAGWLLLQGCLAWLPGHPSLLGRMAGVHCVQDCPDYPDHQLSAPAWRVVAAGLLDALFAGITCSASGLLSAALVLLLNRRQTAGQLLVNIYCVQEVTCGTAALPLFPSPQSKTPGSILQSSQPRAAHLRRRAAAASTPTPTHGTGTPLRGQLFATPLSAAPGTNSPSRGLTSNAATPVQTRAGSTSAAFNWEHTPVTVGRANAAGTGVAVVGAGAGPSGAGVPWSFGSGRRGVETEITAAPIEAAACGDAGHVPWSFGSARSAALGQVAGDETPNVRGLLRAAKVAGAARAPWSFGSGRQAPVPDPAPSASPARTQHGGHGLLHAASTMAAAGGSFGSPAAAVMQSPWRMGTEQANVIDDGDAELRAAFGVQREVLISPAVARRRA